MTQTEFTGEINEFEYAGYAFNIKYICIYFKLKYFLIIRHKLRVGDQGTFVLCNLVSITH